MGGPCPPPPLPSPSPSPCTDPALAWLRLYNTPKIDYATSGNKKQ